MNSWQSYPKIYNVGHKAVEKLLTVPVIVQEKVDGSQFSFGIDHEGEMHHRSKGVPLYPDGTKSMFSPVIDYVVSIKDRLVPGWTYRAEYLMKPKHNSLAYDRVPQNNLVLFDINDGEESYLSYGAVELAADALEIDVAPLLFEGALDRAMFDQLLKTTSFLGGQKIEGIVIKQANTSLFGPDKKALIAKHVSEQFREIHGKTWKGENPNTVEIIEHIAQSLRTPSRWDKALQHLRESGNLTDSPKDIGPAMKEIAVDVRKECEELIKEQLFNYAWPKISRVITQGFPEYYKEKLVDLQFAGADDLALCS